MVLPVLVRFCHTHLIIAPKTHGPQVNLIQYQKHLAKIFMLKKIKNLLYFPLAAYFKFWAQIKLNRWQPKVIVITGSNGKTFLLHLLQSQIGNRAYYTHNANSSFGLSFSILGLHRSSFSLAEWPIFFLLSPFLAFGKPPSEKILVAEADCDRSKEGEFLSGLLKPDITLWQNVSLAHSEKFPGSPERILERIAYEYGWFIERTKFLAVVNSDSPEIAQQLARTKAQTIKINKKDLKKYEASLTGTAFVIGRNNYYLPFVLPEESFSALEMTRVVLDHLHLPFTTVFSRLTMAPGRSSLFKGIKKTMLLDSTYNNNLASCTSMLNMVNKLKQPTWLIIGDLLELGETEKNEHQKLAHILKTINYEKLILVGRRTAAYTFPILKGKEKNKIISFIKAKDALEYLKKELQEQKLLLIKGGGFLEKMVEELLQNKTDAKFLCRREAIWQKRREKFYS